MFKDLILLIPYIIAMGIGVVCHLLIYLLLSFSSFLIFIYEKAI